ncbi:acyl esterase [Sphingomonas bacterium]|uniref:acyl esterase n=1 Tax=Sphingomonas bacterium TaxID=1895847 RepID=UPI0015770304|nr:acyl esterase [Sphingomonas bacterium]
MIPAQPASVPAGVRVLRPDDRPTHPFTICALVTRPDQYDRMLSSYRAAGFGDDCEYLCIDNSRGNVHDAFTGYNAFLVEARGEFVILTHQDVELCFDDRATLEARLRELTARDPGWALCGNAGGIAVGRVAMRITDPHGDDITLGDLPQPVTALDENFLVVRRDANLCLSRDLSGYHMYGADLCVMADILGHRAYVIDFHLRHLSGGTLDDSFRTSAAAFDRKYARAFRSRWIQTTVTEVFLSGSRLVKQAATSRVAGWWRRRT